MINFMQRAWSDWCGLFDGLPYGDPYLAFATLFVLIVVIARLATGGDASRHY
ncbi:MAG: hypothetical protein HQ512_08145 [Rhodospirillales bacterium]|nr:hypothetical protein [Rhodospirillales bacterium]